MKHTPLTKEDIYHLDAHRGVIMLIRLQSALTGLKEELCKKQHTLQEITENKLRDCGICLSCRRIELWFGAVMEDEDGSNIK